MNVPNKYMSERTNGAQRAPIARPYLTLTAWGMILVEGLEHSREKRKGHTRYEMEIDVGSET